MTILALAYAIIRRRFDPLLSRPAKHDRPDDAPFARIGDIRLAHPFPKIVGGEFGSLLRESAQLSENHRFRFLIVALFDALDRGVRDISHN